MNKLSVMVSSSLLAALFMACRLPGLEVFAVAPVHLNNQVHQMTASDEEARTVVDMTAEELLRYYPSELQDLEFDANQDELAFLLAKTGERVQALFRDLSNTSSKEKVLLQRLSSDGNVEASTSRDFYYLILTNSGEPKTRFEEYRTDTKMRPIRENVTAGFLISSGYACLSIYFHRNQQAGSCFRYLGRQNSESRAHVVAFAQRREVREYLAGYTGYTDPNHKESIGLLIQGIAWIDPLTYQITRMRTNLLATERPSLLYGQTTDSRFSEVRMEGLPQSIWLPREVMVTWKVAGRTYRNRHQYSDYKLFSVESDYKVDQPRINK